MKLRVLATTAIAACILPSAFAQLSGLTPAQTKPVATKSLAQPAPWVGGGSSALLVGGSDSCSTPDAIAGAGPHAFDTTAASTGAEGQSEALCNFFAQTGISNDVWYSWTAASTGTATLTTCGMAGNDTKVAVYAGGGCPTGSALACNDDTCGLQSQVTFSAVAGSTYTIQLGGYPGTPGATGSFSISVAGPTTNDDCTGPTTISGAGPHPFNTSGASTGAQGQSEAICNFFAQTGIANDVWFTWTAGSNGIATLSLCGGAAFDTKAAIYAGAGCPTGSALACNDDSCGLQTQLTFPVTSGTTYTIQLGSYPGTTGGTGTFTLNIGVPPGPCSNLDDGMSNNAIGLTAGGGVLWLQRFGAASGSTTVSSIATTYGSSGNGPGQNPANGTPSTIAIWDDPNDDGNPTDGVLLQTVAATVVGAGTEQFAVYNLSPAVTVNGYLFVGATLVHAAGQFPAPLDQPTSTGAAGAAWIAGEGSGAVNLSSLGSNSIPPTDVAAVGFPGQWLLRVTCGGGSAVTPFCIPGTQGVTACPCNNPNGPNRGCNNSDNTGGALQATNGTPSLSNDTLQFITSGEKATATSVFLQGTSQTNGVVFGQGIRCTAGTLLRLYVKTAVNGTARAPQIGDPSVSQRAAALGDVLNAGDVRYHQTYYRDPIVLGGCPSNSTFNVSSGSIVTWAP